ncbi:imelysin family protein [Pseudoalteromonas sp. Of7M-16]|uniref:imelysin family protein n=1 Tax=Pseudoalteromonas sp. Of7M-16 TaxID=2917756 RepID=UPI001EF6F31D|nr:imelysin family protein [Pseudoalteromonas sp. Of7M-16]MCG7550792.1 hypothetical protein [Pseudoalteromonas sp. Of7M-16]
MTIKNDLLILSIVSSLCLPLLSGCGGSGGDSATPTNNAGADNGTSDGGTSDGGTSDGGTSDGGTSDGGTSDGGTSDGGTLAPGEMQVAEGQSKVLGAVSDSVITPMYQSFLDSTQSLVSATNTYCNISEPQQSDLSQLQDSWKQVNSQWQMIRATKFGPLADNFTYSRIQLWPFLPSRIVSSVESTIETSYDFSQGFNDSTHQRQGLPAFEYLVFNQETDTNILTAADKAQRCNYLKAIASNVNSLMTSVNSQWVSEFSQQFKAGNGEFESSKSALETLFKYWFEYLEVIADDKLKKPLGLDVPGKPEELESHWAQVSLQSIESNITSLKALYDAGDEFGFDDYLVAVNNREDLKDDINERFEVIFAILKTMEGNKLADLIQQSEGREKINELGVAITALRTVMSTDFVQVTDIQPGFNTNDGD